MSDDMILKCKKCGESSHYTLESKGLKGRKLIVDADSDLEQSLKWNQNELVTATELIKKKDSEIARLLEENKKLGKLVNIGNLTVFRGQEAEISQLREEVKHLELPEGIHDSYRQQIGILQVENTRLLGLIVQCIAVISDLTGYCGNEAFDRSVKRGQALLSEIRKEKI